MISYRELNINEINLELFDSFERRQIVTKCRRKDEATGKWIIIDNPFIDDWNEEEYKELVRCLKETVTEGGFVYGSFVDNKLKGFVAVKALPIGSHLQYMDLASIHVSEDMRRNGIGRKLFLAAKKFAEKNRKKLYISAHSAVESQEFYRAMGCVEAKEYNAEHVKEEPYDCQLECE